MASFRNAVMAKEKISPKVITLPEVVAIGVGFANPNRPAKGAGINVYTLKNLSKSKISSLHAAISSTIRATGFNTNVPIRVIPSGMFRATAPEISSEKPRLTQIYRNRIRPVPGGVSIGKTMPNSTGTAGINVVRGSQLFIFGNNHVLIKNNSTEISEIIQPGPADNGVSPRDRVGYASAFVPLQRMPAVNYVDAAIARPLTNNLLNPRYLATPFQYIVIPGYFANYPVGMKVKKTGRRTGFTTGVVESINVTQTAIYDSLPQLGVVLFENQTVIRSQDGRPTATGGDSGSVWLDQESNFAVSCTYAASEDGLEVATFPIVFALQRFQATIARPVGSNKFKAGLVKKLPMKDKFAYVKPLTKAQLDSIKVVRIKAPKSLS
ncbi:hypothetical protein [Robertmurraya sp.]|uniref:hypothetical protein n=1 Tax=Robertmurraya sp. TaxID=2837525 RepID=UPI003703F6AF